MITSPKAAAHPSVSRKHSRRRWLVTGGVALVVLLGVAYLGASVYVTQRLTTSPNRVLDWGTPDHYGLQYSDVSFQSRAADHITLRGWWLPSGTARRVVIFIHGRYSRRDVEIGQLHYLTDAGYNVLTFDMRGHGVSDGDHFTYGQDEQDDILGALDWVRSRGYDPDSIGAVAQSMGAASALLAMAQTPNLHALVSDSSYADAASLLQRESGPLYPGVAAISRLRWSLDYAQIRPIDAITKLGNRHVYLIHGSVDPTIPVSDAYALQKAGGASVTALWVAPSVRHLEVFGLYSNEYERRVLAFFDQELAK